MSTVKVFFSNLGSNLSQGAGGDNDGGAGPISGYDGSDGERRLSADDIVNEWRDEND